MQSLVFPPIYFDMKTKAQIRIWLKSAGKDRNWLAETLGTKKSVIDSWFSSRGFPPDKMAAILALMEPKDSVIRVPFTDQQLKNTNEAAALTGYGSDLQAYCQKAIATQVEIDLQRATVIPLPRTNPDQQETPKTGNGAH